MATILVADDNANTQKMVSLAFEEKGVAVVAVGNGEAAVRKLPVLKPDVVLADVFMPVRNGYEVCEFVKKDPRFSKVPVILLVGAFDPLDENEARRVGADGILKKPFVPPDPMIAMVTSALEKATKVEVAPQAAVPFSEVAPPKPARPSAPVPAAVQKEEEATEEQLYAYGTGRRDLDEDDGRATSASVGLREQVEEEERESRFHESHEERHRPDARDISEPEVPTSTTIEPAIAAPEAVAAASPPTEEVAPAEEKEARKEEPLSAAIAPPVPPEAPAASTEWMEMMAPPPPAGHPVAWSAPGEPVATQPEPEETSAEAPKEVFTAAPEEHDLPQVSEPVTGVPEERDLELPIRTEFPAPAPYVDAEAEKASSYPYREPPSAPSASNEQSQLEQTGPTALEEETAPVEIAQPGVPEASETFDSAGTPAPASSQSEDSSTVDAVVEQVLQRLGPRLQDFLASGVLRPIVKEALQDASNKKK